MVCKESVVQEMSRVDFDEQLKNSTVILIDVAGTTTALSFIKETLFPYVTDNVKTYLSDNWEKESIIELLNKLREECSDLPSKDEEGAAAANKDKQLDKFVEYIIKKTQENSESIPIKTIQGLVYEHGYTKGLLKGHVFEDVGVALESWSRDNKRRVCVYSSGSVESQKLLFGWSSAGDLTSHINTHFDQSAVGAKTDALSYKNIASQLDCKPEAIVFLTDSVEEAKAASEAGVNAVLVSREGNTPITDEHKKLFPIVNSFKELPLNELEVNAVESAADATVDVVTTSESSEVKVEQTAVAAADVNEVDSDVSAKRKLPADEEPQTETEPPTKIAKTEEMNDKLTKEDENVVEVNKVESTTTTTVVQEQEQENKSETKPDDKQSTEAATTVTVNSTAEEAMEGVEEEEATPAPAAVSTDDKKQNEEIKDETKVNNKETEVVNNSSDKIETTTSSNEASEAVTSSESVTTPAAQVESMEVDEESPSSETTNIEVSTSTEKKSTESKGTQVAIKVSNNDVASQAEMDPKALVDDKKVENEATPVEAVEAAPTTEDKERPTEVTEKQSEVVSTVDTTEEQVKEEAKSNTNDQLKSSNDSSAQIKSTTNDEVKTTSSSDGTTENDTKNDDKPQSTTTAVVEEGEATKKQDDEPIIEKPDTTTTNVEEKMETNVNGSSNNSDVDMKIEEKQIPTTTTEAEEETKSDDKSTTSSTADVVVESEQKQQETENNKITSDEIKKTEEVKTLKKDDNETEIIKKSETKETKQTDDHVPENNKQVKENGSTKETLETTCEKTEQKTEKLDATKSNGANGVGVEEDATKSNNKNGVTNGDDTNKNGTNNTTTTTSTTTSTSTLTDDDKTTSSTTEIKVKTVSDVVGAVAAEGAVDVAAKE